MASGARRAGDRAGNRAERSAEGGRVSGRVERAGAPAGLDDDRRTAERGDHPVAQQESPLRRRRARRHLRDHDAPVGDAPEQLLVPARVEAIQAAGENRDGRALTGERRTVRRSVDAVGGTRHDRESAVDEPARRLDRHVLAVAGRRPSADERDRPLERRRACRRRRAPTGRTARAPRARRAAAGQSSSPGTSNRIPNRAACRSASSAGADALRGRQRLSASVHWSAEISASQTSASSAASSSASTPEMTRSSAATGPSACHQHPGIPIARLGDGRPRRSREAFGDAVAIQLLPRDRADQRRELRLGDSRDAHATAACRRSRARPTWSSPGRSAPSRSAIVQASRSTRS